MIELRTITQSQLKAVHPRVYFQVAPENEKFPYLVYDLRVYDSGENHQLVTLDVDGWGNSADTTTLETLMADVNKNLNKQTVITDNIVVTFYLENKLAMTDDDPRIKRRKYIYQGRLFERS